MANLIMGNGAITHKLNILAVDDDTSFCAILRDTFSEDFDFKLAYSAGDALRVLSQGGVDLVLLDISLPDLSGLMLLKMIHEKRPGLPIIMLTGTSDFRTAISAM